MCIFEHRYATHMQGIHSFTHRLPIPWHWAMCVRWTVSCSSLHMHANTQIPLLQTHTFDNTPHRLVLPRPPFFWAGCGFTLASFLHTCVCPLVHPFCSSVPQTVTTTQYHSVWTSNGSPSSRATRLLQCFTQVSDMVFTTQHNRHNWQHITTTRESAAVQWRVFLRTAHSDPQHSEELWSKTCYSVTQAPVRVVPMDASTHLNSENR
jgi:hypothetical protein